MLRGRVNYRAGSYLTAAAALPAVLALANAFGTVPRTPAPSTRADAAPELTRQFRSVVLPFLNTYCLPCHGKENPDAQLNLAAYSSLASVMADDAHWARILDKVSANQMPPSHADKQPPSAQRDAVVAWMHAVQQYEAGHRKDTGDPGPVLARRLSNAEYNNTIRDLTGADLQPAREFPVDPADQEGFDNSGESLTMSGALMKKYVQAAKDIADHLVLTSTGIQFATHPVLAETDRDKFCILRIVDFYKHQPTDYADYFTAAWRYQNRAALGMPNATLPSVAAYARVSPRYLALVWETLNTPRYPVGPIAKLQEMWKALPAPTPGKEREQFDAAKQGCVAMRDWVQSLRKKVAWKFDNLAVPNGFSVGGQCFVLYKDREYATHRMLLNPNRLHAVIPAAIASAAVPTATATLVSQTAPAKPAAPAPDPDTVVPQDAAARAPYVDAFGEFCRVFPDAFYIAERGRMFVDDPGDQGRLLTAGLHNSMGYFRDDTPLMDLMLSDVDRQKLNQMWQDFDMVAFVPERMHSEFFVYERAESGTITDPEFNFARAEDKAALSDAKIKLLGDLYLAKARRNGGQPETLAAIADHFKRVSVNIRTAERERLTAEPVQRKALVDFAQRAYRRPLTVAERADVLAFYQELRQKDGLTHEDAMRDSVVRILLSPDFLFRMDLEAPTPTTVASATTAAVSGETKRRTGRRRTHASVHPTALRPPVASATEGILTQPLSDYDLANRLSYFLWSSMPDDELMAHAAAGDLHRPEVLTAQTQRMLRDPRVRALTLEFGGNWLDFRHFDQNNTVDRNRFPTFTNDLRQAMFEEPIHFLMDTIQNDRSVLNLLYGKYTFVNSDLARHYEMKDVAVPKGDWVRVDHADQYGRGGLLPMGVFLTQNSPGLRTSPVKRGYWVVRRVLGEYIPPPPPTVPALPKDESQLGDLTLRQALARHRQDPACAGCHARFDSYGLVFEGYGPTGERRAQDLGGKPIDAHAPFPGGTDREGVGGLQSFIGARRQQDFIDTLDRKLYAYALGRSLLPSDGPALTHLSQRMAADQYRFGTLVQSIVTSRQFRYRRATATSAPSASSPSGTLARN